MMNDTYPSIKHFVCAVCVLAILVAPAYAFTAQSLDITVDKNGDAIADFRFALEGALENAIPQSMLEDELKKGLTTNSDPPVILSFDRSGVSMLMKNFAMVTDVPTGTEYQTASMDFKKAEIALQNSAVSSVISADFSPQSIVITFPDGYSRTFTDSSVLPSLRHIIIDPDKKVPVTDTSMQGSLSISSSPDNALVYVDSVYAGNTPFVVSGIAPGDHEIRLELDGFVTLTKTVTITPGNVTTDVEVLSYVPKTPEQNGWGWTGILVVIGLVVIVVAGCSIIMMCQKPIKK
ncbi:MAG: PEGA domain-containing protein [Methanoregula sp.]